MILTLRQGILKMDDFTEKEILSITAIVFAIRESNSAKRDLILRSALKKLDPHGEITRGLI